MRNAAKAKFRESLQPGAFKLPEACRYLGGIAPITMRRLVSAGKITPNRKLRHLLFPRPELDRWLNEQ